MKNKFLNNSIITHSIFIVSSLVLFLIYFAPSLTGKSLFQNDVVQSVGAIKEAQDFYNKTGEEVLWSNSIFSGMPVWRGFNSNILIHGNQLINEIIPIPVLICFIGFLGFYILLRVLKVNPWLSFAGGMAYALSSFTIISIEAGHINKVLDMVLMAPVLAGVILTYNGSYWRGAGLTILSLTLQIFYSHVQISYYLIIIIAFYLVAQFITALREKSLNRFFTASAIMVVCVVIAVGPNISRLWTMSEYAKSTMRGGSDLSTKQYAGGGLDKEYALSWSYGVMETMTLFIPSVYGGSSHEELDKNSETYKTMIKNGVAPGQAKQYIKGMPLYWGTQPFTSGPVYFGALICFLFILGLILVDGPIKWWILSVSVLSIMLAWGKNFEAFTDLFFFHFPLYNKFRSVTMIFCIAQLTFPLLGILTIQKIIDEKIDTAKILNSLKITFIITGLVALFFALFGQSFFSFESESDKQMPEWLIDALREDRISALRGDAIRSLILIILGGGLIWLYVQSKIKETYLYIGISVILIFDLWAVDRRYLDKNDFKDKKSYERNLFAESPIDATIKKDTDLHYRVFNLSGNPFSDAITSYHHSSIGGYSGIKLSRYQDLIEAHLSKPNISVLSMLNTKYFIVTNKNTNEPMVQRNPDALGNAWFVSNLKLVKNADEELKSLDNFNPKTTAFIDNKFADYTNGLNSEDSNSTDKITLTNYHPNRLEYKSTSTKEQLAVFSEVYYQPGWNAYIDNKLVPHIRVNYILRALKVPAGEHVIQFKFEPESYFIGERISLAGSIILVIVLVGLLIRELVLYKKKQSHES